MLKVLWWFFGQNSILTRVVLLNHNSMSDKQEQEGELIDTQPESAADGADDTQEGEQTQEDLDLEDSSESKSKVAKGEEQKQKKILAYQGKIDRGEITIESLPKDEQWLAEHLKARPEVKEAGVDEDAIDRALTKREQEKQFLIRKERLESADLPSDKIKKLNEKYKLFREKGLSKLDALEAAEEIAQIDLEDQQVTRKRSAMKLPKPGGKSQTKDYEQLYKDLPYSEAMKVIPEDKLNEILKKSARS